MVLMILTEHKVMTMWVLMMRTVAADLGFSRRRNVLASSRGIESLDGGDVIASVRRRGSTVLQIFVPVDNPAG